MKKKLLLTLLALLSAELSVQIQAYDARINGIYYNLNKSTKTAEVTQGGSYSSSVTIPETIVYNGDTYSVTSIGNSAFYRCNLSSITIPNSVTTIQINAFSQCSYLTSVAIPNSVITIGDSAFSGCNLSSITIGNGVTSIGENAFQACKRLTSITIPNSVTSIGYKAFWGCSGLTSVTIGNGVTEIGFGAFLDCNALTSVRISDLAAWCKIKFGDGDANPLYYTHKLYLNGTLVKKLVIPSNVISIGDDAFINCDGITSVTIPNSVTAIGNYAFTGCSSLSSITIPNSVTAIGNCAFSGCSSLSSITIPNSVSSIGSDAFSSTTWYTNQPNGLVYIAKVLYKYKGTMPANTTITIQEGTLGIAGAAFSGCSGLISVTIPNSVTSIGKWAFSGCSSLNSIIIPNSVTSIDNLAFQNCSRLTSISVGSGNTVYDSRNNCNAIIETQTNTLVLGCITTTIPNNITAIGYGAFYGCSDLTSVTLPETITSIGDYAFDGCSSLASIIIPKNVTSIGNYAFYGCDGLTRIKAEMEMTTFVVGLKSYTFPNSNIFYNNATLFYPKSSSSFYDTYWSRFTSRIGFPDGDVNRDGLTDVVDVVDIVRFIVGTTVVGTTAAKNVEFLADMDGNREVNVADAVVLVNEIAGDTQFAKPAFAPRKAVNDALTLNCNGSNLSLEMEGTGHYTAFQFDLWLPADMDLMQVSLNDARRQGHQLLFNKMGDGHYRVVALSTSGNVFNGTSGELLSMTLDDFATDDVRIDNIHFVTARGIDVPFEAIGVCNGNNGVTTDIHSVDSNNTTKPVYNLNGQRLTAPRKGLNIIGGKKIVVK